MQGAFEPKNFEKRIYDNWLEKKYFKAEVNKKKKAFTVVIPPPNITGQLHLGHALNCTIQDIIVRYKRMKGFEALWLPGTDHASIATEVKIVEKLRAEGISKEDLGREGFLKRAYEWKDQYGGRIVEQLKTMGFSCDWDRLAFTMDERCSKAVKSAFVKMYDKGLIYKGDRIINWCPVCKTAISDAEVEFETEQGKLWHLKYPIEGSDEYIVVATTRPETMLGDTAVAVNPKDKRYKHLKGKNVMLPIMNRSIPIVFDHYVEMEFGTGAVKITPAHDPNDFEVGTRHNLEVIRVMNDDATMNEAAGRFNGMSREDVRKAVLKELDSLGLLIKEETHEHNVGHCYRCDTAIEPMVSKQWFVKMSELAKPAVKAVKDGDIDFLPKRFEKTYFNWMENIRDWCISRQLWWGHRIPVYYCDDCGCVKVSEVDIKTCPECGGKVRQEEDVLDTWFSSALWPFSTLGWPDKTPDLEYFYPTDVLITAYDIITFWVSRMIFSGLEYMGEKPFSTVLINGLVRDEFGRKMSKSSNNGIDPLEVVDKYGTDSLRFSLVNGISAGGDTRFSEEKIEGCRNFMNKIWNASKFVLMNTQNTVIKDIKDVDLKLSDKWILSLLNSTIKSVSDSIDAYDVGQAAAALYDFTWNKFCDWYIEMSKTALYSSDDNLRSDTVSVLVYVLRSILKLIHPFIPFVTEEIYSELPNKDAESIMISDYPEYSDAFTFDTEFKAMERIMDVIKSVRALRQEMGVSQSKRTMLYVVPEKGHENTVKSSLLYVEKLAMGSGIEMSEPVGKTVKIVTEICQVYIPMDQLVDFDKERERLARELELAESEIARAEGKLKNQGFVAKAPAKLIEEEQEKLKKYIELKEKLVQSIKELG